MNEKRTDPVAVALLLAIAFFAFLEYRLLLYAQYIMDEFLHFSWGGDIHFGVRPYVDYVPFKSQLGILLYSLAYKLSSATEGILLINRHTAFVFVILSLYVLFRLHRQVFGNARGGLWAVLWTLSCSTFREHSFSIRVDMMATGLALVGLHVFLKESTWRRALAAGLLLGTAFCTTQKSLYFIVAFVVSFWLVRRQTIAETIREFAAFALGGLAAFSAYVLVFGSGGHHFDVVKATFFSEKALSLALEGQYRGLGAFYWQTFSRNIPFYCLAFAGLGYAIAGWRAQRREQRFLCCFSLTVLALLVLHREPWPYVFVLIIPFLGAYAGAVSDRAVEALTASPRAAMIPAVALLVTVGIQQTVRNEDYAGVECFPQMHTVRAAESVLGPNDTYFDGVRMVGTRKYCASVILEQRVLNDLITNWETEGPTFLDSLRTSECKVIIYNYRLARLPKAFHEFLRNHYVLMDRNVFASGCEISTSPASCELIWAGEYGTLINGECRNVVIDGKPITDLAGGIRLAAGQHQVTFEGNGAFLLIPVEARRWMEDNRVERVVLPLFINVYER
jgi:hypothetical protein